MNVRIEHCTVCWGYRDRALALADALRKRFGAHVEVAGGTLGQFDVRVDGRLISSRGESLLARITPPRLPDVSDIISRLEPQDSLPAGAASRAESTRPTFGPDDAKRFYDRFGRWQDTQFYERTALKYLVAHAAFERASAVFEWGCGTGRLAECLFERHLRKDATYVGIDISTTMISIAARRLATWSGRATVKEVDGTLTLPYPDSAFDRFVATYVLDLLPEPTVWFVLSEAHRLLRPDGTLCVAGSTEGVGLGSRMLSSIWKRVYAFNPRLVGGCRPLCVSMLLRAAWKVALRHVVCSWGISSEIVIASPV
jgi:ubiquinone/menaquinone biosynthesis C-methylase UbiE